MAIGGILLLVLAIYIGVKTYDGRFKHKDK